MSGALSPVHWLIIIGVVVVLFGAKKMPEAARGIGQSLRIFKAEFSDASDHATPSDHAAPSEPPAVGPSPTPADQAAAATAAPAPAEPSATAAEPHRSEPHRSEANRSEPHRSEPGRSEPGRGEPGRDGPGRDGPGRDGPGGSAVLGAVDMPGESAASSRSFSPAHDVSPAGGEEHRRVNGR